MRGKTFAQKDQWVVEEHIFTLRVSVKRLRFLFFFAMEEDIRSRSLNKRIAAWDRLVNVQVWWLECICLEHIKLLYDKDIWRERKKGGADLGRGTCVTFILYSHIWCTVRFELGCFLHERHDSTHRARTFVVPISREAQSEPAQIDDPSGLENSLTLVSIT